MVAATLADEPDAKPRLLPLLGRRTLCPEGISFSSSGRAGGTWATATNDPIPPTVAAAMSGFLKAAKWL